MPRPQAACCTRSPSATLLLLFLPNRCKQLRRVESGKRTECHGSADLGRIQRTSPICATAAVAVAIDAATVARVAAVAALNSQLACKCSDTCPWPRLAGSAAWRGWRNYRRRKPNGMPTIILMMNSEQQAHKVAHADWNLQTLEYYYARLPAVVNKPNEW